MLNTQRTNNGQRCKEKHWGLAAKMTAGKRERERKIWKNMDKNRKNEREEKKTQNSKKTAWQREKKTGKVLNNR